MFARRAILPVKHLRCKRNFPFLARFTRARVAHTPFLLDLTALGAQNIRVKIRLTLIALMSALPVMAEGAAAESAVTEEQTPLHVDVAVESAPEAAAEQPEQPY